MNIHHKARHMMAVGKSGMGKTSYLLKYLSGCSHDRVLVFDHQGEIAARLNARPEQVVATIEEMASAVETHRMVFFDPTVHYGGYFPDIFEEFCTAVLDLSRDHFEPAGMDTLFVCDEIQQFCKIGSVPPSFKAILETGRRANLDSFCLSQRPNKIDSDLREQWTEIVFFRLDDKNSHKFIEDCGADLDAVLALPPHNFLFYQRQTSESRSGNLGFSASG